MFGGAQRKLKLLFGLSDLVLSAFAFSIAYALRRWLPLTKTFYFTAEKTALLLGFSAGACILIGYGLNVYGKVDAAQIRTILADSFRQAAYEALSLVVFVYMLRMDTSRVFLSSFIVLSWLLLTAFRIVARNLIPVVRRQFGVNRYVVIVGVGDRARRHGRTLESWYEHGLRIVGFMAGPEDGPAPQSIQLRREYPVMPLRDLQAIVRKHVIDEVHFAVDSERLAALEDTMLACDDEGVCSRIAVDFFPHVNSQMALEHLGGTPLLTFSAAPDDGVLLLVKRVLDIALAAIGLILLSPVFAIAAILVRITSPGPIVFRQIRCGLNGRKFTFYKFRSMAVDAEARFDEVAHLSSRGVATKFRNDPRLTPIGAFLRRFSLDELPQLFNVLKGDMSLVGPRPAIPSEVAQYKRWQRRRLRMRPGLTCLWALNGRDRVDFETWMRLDMSYIDNWSLGLDARIILKTIPQVLSGRGAS